MEFIKFLPSWEKFGWNRDKSIIGTTSFDTAFSWGVPHIIIPKENIVYVSDGDDFNHSTSWKFFTKELKSNIKSDIEFIDVIISGLLVNYIYDFLTHLGYNGGSLSEGAFSIIDENIDELVYLYEGDEEKEDEDIAHFLLEGMQKHGVIEFLDFLFDPIKNGFKKMKYTELMERIYKNGEYQNNEVWFTSDCILLSQNDFIKLQSQLKNF